MDRARCHQSPRSIVVIIIERPNVNPRRVLRRHNIVRARLSRQNSRLSVARYLDRYSIPA